MCASATTNRALFEGLPLLLILIVLCWGGLVLPAAAQQAVPELTGRIVDRAEILSPAIEETLTALLTAHEDSTSNQVAVLTIPALGGETVEAYSIRVAETWALGTAEKDNGVLLLVAIEDRKLRIEVGYGLEGTLPDAVAGRIIREEIVPYFREGNPERGVEMGVLAVLARLESQAEPVAIAGPEVVETEPVAETPVPFSIDWWQVIAFSYFLAFLVLCSVAAALAVLEDRPRKILSFIVLLICFFFIGRNLGYFVFWTIPAYGLAVVIAGLYAALVLRLMGRIDKEPSFKAAWQRRLLIHGPDPDTKKGTARKAEEAATSASPYPRRTQTVVLLAFATQLALFLFTRWLPVIWLIVGAVLAWFCLARIAETAEQRKRRHSTTWTPFGAMPSASSRSSRSRRRSYTGSSWSRPSSSSWSSSSSSSWSSSSSSSYSSSSSSSYSGGGGSFGGGGASGSW